MPARPGTAPTIALAEFNPSSPYERIAADLRTKIIEGTLRPGLPIPSVKAIAGENGVSVSTAQRAVKLLHEWGLVEVNSGRRTLVRYNATGEASSAPDPPDARPQVSGGEVKLLDLELRQLLVGASRRSGGDLADIGDYELAVAHAGSADLLTTFVAMR